MILMTTYGALLMRAPNPYDDPNFLDEAKAKAEEYRKQNRPKPVSEWENLCHRFKSAHPVSNRIAESNLLIHGAAQSFNRLAMFEHEVAMYDQDEEPMKLVVTPTDSNDDPDSPDGLPELDEADAWLLAHGQSIPQPEKKPNPNLMVSAEGFQPFEPPTEVTHGSMWYLLELLKQNGLHHVAETLEHRMHTWNVRNLRDTIREFGDKALNLIAQWAKDLYGITAEGGFDAALTGIFSSDDLTDLPQPDWDSILGSSTEPQAIEAWEKVRASA